MEYKALHLGCGTDTWRGFVNVDQIDHPGVDVVHDLNQYPWPWEDDSVQRIVANHVFEHLDSMQRALTECERIMRPDAALEIRLPIGMNAHADPRHVWGEEGQPWAWKTPEYHCGLRPWDPDCGLEVVHRDVELHSHYPAALAAAQHAKWALARLLYRGPGAWCWGQPAASGEFYIQFRPREEHNG